MTKRDTISPELHNAMRAIVLTTGDLPGYQPIDIAFSTVIVGRLEGEPPERAFESAREQLRLAAVQMGGDAVMACHFTHTVHGQTQTEAQEEWTYRSLFTVHAYGTVAKRV
jgi:uncharacterized protein YbjQ (UPF0145 family)